MHASISADQLLRGLALSVARNEVGARRPIGDVLAGEGLTQTEYDAISTNPQFKRYVDAYVADLQENGYSFAAKSKVLAEDLLPIAYHMARDNEVPAAVRAKLIENMVEWADLKPKKAVENAPGAGFSITFNIPGVPTQTIEATRGDVVDVLPPELAALPSFDKPTKKPSVVLLDEPDTYEYGGEDVLE